MRRPPRYQRLHSLTTTARDRAFHRWARLSPITTAIVTNILSKGQRKNLVASAKEGGDDILAAIKPRHSPPPRLEFQEGRIDQIINDYGQEDMHRSLWALVAAAQAGETDILPAADGLARFPQLLYPHKKLYTGHQHTKSACNLHLSQRLEQLKTALRDNPSASAVDIFGNAPASYTLVFLLRGMRHRPRLQRIHALPAGMSDEAFHKWASLSHGTIVNVKSICVKARSSYSRSLRRGKGKRFLNDIQPHHTPRPQEYKSSDRCRLAANRDSFVAGSSAYCDLNNGCAQHHRRVPLMGTQLLLCLPALLFLLHALLFLLRGMRRPPRRQRLGSLSAKAKDEAFRAWAALPTTTTPNLKHLSSKQQKMKLK